MITIEFNYEGQIINIQDNEEDKMENIIQEFASKVNVTDLNSLRFIYNGDLLTDGVTIKEIINSEDEETKIMHILVNSKFKKTKEIICPECKDTCKIEMNDYVISLFGCKEKHEKPNLIIKDFVDTQNLDESKIICDKCKNDKSNIYNDEFYTCKTCKRFMPFMFKCS